MSAITEIQDTIGSVAARVGPAVVGFGRGAGRGSGVIVAPGRIVTAAHNLRGEAVPVAFADGRRAEGRVRGTDADLDLAVLEADTGAVGPVEWDPAAAPPAIGAAVVALANPGARGLRATPGFVSSAARSFRGPRGRRIEACIEHTAPLPSGSGGGPLVDPAGRLLGLNVIRLDGGLILAIPAGEEFARRVEALFRGERDRGVRLGVAVAPPRVARRLRRAVGLPERDGLLVRSVSPGSLAERAGIAPGDLIVAAGGLATGGIDALYEALDSAAPGESLGLTVVRGADEHHLAVRVDKGAVDTGGNDADVDKEAGVEPRA